MFTSNQVVKWVNGLHEGELAKYSVLLANEVGT